MSKTRLKDIAARAKVSLGTVDRVLNNRGRVAKATRIKVMSIAKEIGYTKNPHATILAQQHMLQRIGCIVPERGKSPYWDQVHAGITEAKREFHASNLNVELLEFPLHDAEQFMRLLQSISPEQYNGIVVAPIFHREWTTCEIKIPFVAINTMVKDQDQLVSFVGPDSLQSGRLAGRLLCQQITDSGSILLLPLEKDYGNADHLISKEKGLREYCWEKAPNVQVVTREYEHYEDRPGLRKFIAETLDDLSDVKAIYTGTCRIHEVAACLEEIGITDLVTCGYDPIPANLDYLEKGLISFLIGQNASLMGYHSMKVLYQNLLLKTTPPKYRHVPLDVILPENSIYHQKGQSSWHPSERLFALAPLANSG